jgi:hypothetical protein
MCRVATHIQALFNRTPFGSISKQAGLSVNVLFERKCSSIHAEWNGH